MVDRANSILSITCSVTIYLLRKLDLCPFTVFDNSSKTIVYRNLKKNVNSIYRIVLKCMETRKSQLYQGQVCKLYGDLFCTLKSLRQFLTKTKESGEAVSYGCKYVTIQFSGHDIAEISFLHTF